MNQRFKDGLFVTGVRKCGTTTVYDFLKNTGHYQAGRLKEPQFFCLPETTVSGHLDWYAGLFPNTGDERPILDGSTLYIHEPALPDRISQHFSTSKFILCLRDPARRMFSAYWHQRAKPGGIEQRSFDEVLVGLERNLTDNIYLVEEQTLEVAQAAGLINIQDLGADYHQRHFDAPFATSGLDPWAFFRYAGESLYSRFLGDWTEAPETHLVFFENLLRQPETELLRLVSFAGLPIDTPLHLPPNRNKTFDAGKIPLLNRLARTGTFDWLKRRTPERWKFLIKEKFLPETEKMTAAQYERARKLLEPEYAYWFARHPFLEQLWR